jgi:hypothetical protein
MDFSLIDSMDEDPCYRKLVELYSARLNLAQVVVACSWA